MPISRIGGCKVTTFLLNSKALRTVIEKINKKYK